MGGENVKKKFPETHRFRKQTTMEKNRLEKVRKPVFYKHTNIVNKKWGNKTREKTFPETQVYREQKTMEKNRLEKVRNHVFYKHTNIVIKKWGGGKTRKEKFQKTHD